MSEGTALVTGGAKRIGKSIALYLAKKGYDIALHYSHSEEDAIKTQQEMYAIGKKCILIQHDLKNAKDAVSVIKQAEIELGDLKILVNNAANFSADKLQDGNYAVLEESLAVNFKSPFILTSEFAKYCSHGHVINICDSYITKNKSPYFSYLLSKKILAEFTKMAAYELAPNITVNAICLGITELHSGLSDEFIKHKQQQLPLNKLVAMSDIHQVICGILAAKLLTGQLIFLDGGENLL